MTRFRGIAAAIAFVAAAPAPAAIEFVNNLTPAAASSMRIALGASGAVPVSAEVRSPVTIGPGQGEGIGCTLQWGLPDAPVAELPMLYTGDAGGGRDRYSVSLPIAVLDAGNHRVTVWCSDDGGATRVFADGGAAVVSVTAPSTPPPGNVVVQLFEWKWTDVEQECGYLADTGYTGVQVSAPNEHLDPTWVGGGPWWVRYQPMGYALESRSGTRSEFESMVQACNAAGVAVYVDAVINHMAHAGFNARGTDGTLYSGNSYNFPGSWSPSDFHYCGSNPGQPTIHDLTDFTSRFESQNCELFGLADLDHSAVAVRDGLRLFLQDLMTIGVSGFRVDAAKHIDASDLRSIFESLSPTPYVYQEVYDSAGEQIRGWEYFINGDTTDFGYVGLMGSAFKCGTSSLAGLASLNGQLDEGQNHLVFTDNHDTQRNSGCAVGISFRDSESWFHLANVFMLAHPYGHPRVMSSYYFSDFNDGPPGTPGATADVWVDGEPVGCSSDWVCEHRRTPIANMVRFRAIAAGQGITDWWSDGASRIAFGRGSAAFVALNGSGAGFTRDYDTSMPAGSYCNVTRFDVADGVCVVPGTGTPAPSSGVVEVGADGRIVAQQLDALEALAIHVQAMVTVSDSDGDGVVDGDDNCQLVPNPDQRDTNDDGFGNLCDPDVNDDLIVNFVDLDALQAAFFAMPGDPAWDANLDFNGDGGINFAELAIVKAFFFGPPGPGIGPLEPACEPPPSELDPAAAVGRQLFLRGSMNGWAATPGLNDFANLGDDLYVSAMELVSGSYDYKIASESWDLEFGNPATTLSADAPISVPPTEPGSPNSQLSVPRSGCWRFELTMSDPGNPVLLMREQ